MPTTVTYNSFSLNDNSNWFTPNIDRYTPAQRELQSFKLSFRDNSKVVSAFWGNKIITLSGTLIGSSETNMQSLMSSAKANLAEEEKTLAIPYNGLTLNYIATCVDQQWPRKNFNTRFIPFKLKFLVQNPPFGKDSSSTNHSNDAITGASETSSFTTSGEVPPRPTITLDVNSETDLTEMEFTQDDTGDVITIAPSGGFAASDVVAINTETNSVTLNGSEEDYTGVFPEFIVGTNNYTIDFDSTAHNVDLDIDWQDLYL